jgi:hypothetical protein
MEAQGGELSQPDSPLRAISGQQEQPGMKTSTQTFYHGGRTGRCVNDLILPPILTKVYPALSSDMQRVFLTTTYPKAVWYAVRRALLHGEEVGRVYRVQPNGPLTVDPWGACKNVPDDWYCESATVLEVISPSVEDVMQAACKMRAGVPGLVGFDRVLNVVGKYRRSLTK